MTFYTNKLQNVFEDTWDRFRFKFCLSAYCLCDLEQTNSVLHCIDHHVVLMTLIWEQILYKKFNLWLALNMRLSTSRIHYSSFTVHLMAPKLYHNECTCLRNVYEEMVSLWQGCQNYQKQLKHSKTLN